MPEKNVQNRLMQINQPKIEIKNLPLETLNIAVIGKRGYGKSTMAKYIVSLIRANSKKTLIIFDPMGEYNGDYVFFDIEQFLSHGSDHGLKNKVYVCRFDSDSQYEELFYYIGNLQRVAVVVEESDLFCKPQWIDPNFAKIIKYGRHKDITYIGIARRTAEINNLIISQSHYVISFRQSLQQDQKLLMDYGFSSRISDLPVFSYEMIEI